MDSYGYIRMHTDKILDCIPFDTTCYSFRYVMLRSLVYRTVHCDVSNCTFWSSYVALPTIADFSFTPDVLQISKLGIGSSGGKDMYSYGHNGYESLWVGQADTEDLHVSAASATYISASLTY